MPKNPDEVGAIWKKESARGEWLGISIDVGALLDAVNGEMGKVNLVAFTNDRKTGKQPDFRILVSRPAGTRTTTTPAAPRPPAAQELTDDDIPF